MEPVAGGSSNSMAFMEMLISKTHQVRERVIQDLTDVAAAAEKVQSSPLKPLSSWRGIDVIA